MVGPGGSQLDAWLLVVLVKLREVCFGSLLHHKQGCGSQDTWRHSGLVLKPNVPLPPMGPEGISIISISVSFNL